MKSLTLDFEQGPGSSIIQVSCTFFFLAQVMSLSQSSKFATEIISGHLHRLDSLIASHLSSFAYSANYHPLRYKQLYLPIPHHPRTPPTRRHPQFQIHLA